MEIDFAQIALSLLNSIGMGLHIYHLEDLSDDRTLKMIFANQAAEKFTRIPSDQVIGRTLDENFPGLRQMGIPQIYAEVVRTQQSVVLDDVHYADNRVSESWFAVTAFPLAQQCVGASFENISARKHSELANQRLILELKKKLSEIKTLRGLLPICMDCKKIRDDLGFWNQLENYIHKHTSAELSHSICEDCLQKRYPNEDDERAGME